MAATTCYVVVEGQAPHYLVTVTQMMKRLAVATMSEARKIMAHYQSLGLTAVISEEWDMVPLEQKLLTDKPPIS